MRALRIHDLGGTEGLKVDDVPEPTPGPGEVAIRVRATSLNFRDLLIVKGMYNPRMTLPAVALSDGAGEVVKVGAGVSRFNAGDRVAGAFMPAWVSGPPDDKAAASALGAGSGPGMGAELVCLPASGVVAIPDHLTFEEAATLPCAAVTAWHALVVEGQIKAGDAVLVQGSGGVSLFALQFARMHGARVIATTSSHEKAERLRSLGASDVINYKTTPDWDKAVLSLTGGAGVDHVVEVGGAGTLAKSLKSAKMAGRVSMIGVLSGGSSEVPLFPILMKSLRVQGIYVGSRQMFEDMNRAIELHKLRPVVDRIFPLDQAVEAYKHMEGGSHMGKIVVRV